MYVKTIAVYCLFAISMNHAMKKSYCITEKSMNIPNNRVNSYLTDSQCAIFWAIYTGNISDLKVLLQKMSTITPNDINCQDKEGKTFLHHALDFGGKDEECNTTNSIIIKKMVKLLVRYNADPNIKEFTLGNTPLHYAAVSTYNYAAPSIPLLIKFGGDKNIQNTQGLTPINFAQRSRLTGNVLLFQ